jgi:ankyrin repeat protein
MNRIVVAIILLLPLAQAFCDPNEDLVQAAAQGDLVVVKALIAKGADVNASSSDGITPLIAATQSNNVGMIALLLDHGAYIEKRDGNGRTALLSSFFNRSEGDDFAEARNLLIERGADLDANDDSRTFWDYVRESYYGGTLESMLKKAKPARDILSACKRGDRELAKKFLSRDAAAIRAKDPAGRDGFYWACGCSSDIVKLFFDNGYKLDAANRFGRDALVRAVKENQLGIVRILLDSGAQATLSDSSLNIVYQAMWGNSSISKALVKLLLERGADPNSGGNGCGPMQIAIVNGQVDILLLLLEHGADANAKNCEGLSLLQLAANSKYDYREAIDALSGAGARASDLYTACVLGDLKWIRAARLDQKSVNSVQPSSGGLTPLIYAVKFGHADVAEYLVSRGADINIACYQGSPLMFACASGDLSLAEFLHRKGAAAEYVDSYGNSWSALDSAFASSRIDIAKSVIPWIKGPISSKTLYRAIDSGDIGLVTAILGRGAETDKPAYGPMGGMYSFTVIRAALLEDKTILSLLAARVDLNVRDWESHSIFTGFDYMTQHTPEDLAKNAAATMRALESMGYRFAPSAPGLRLRQKPETGAPLVRSLDQGERLECLEWGKTATIDSRPGFWVKVKTAKNETGWCFEAYLKLVK